MLANIDAFLTPDQLRELFDLRSDSYTSRGGSFTADPNLAWNALRDNAPVYEGTPGQLAGYHGPAVFSGLPFPERRHFTVLDFNTCAQVTQDQTTFSSSPHEPGTPAYDNEAMLLFMDGHRHRRLRSLVRNAFTPKRATWWIDNWITDTIDSLVDLIAPNGRSDLNVEFFGPIPVLTICSSFGLSVAEALEIRAAVVSDNIGLEAFYRIVTPVLEARRQDGRDDLISMLVNEEIDEDGGRQRLSDSDILIFSFLLLAAGSGTTWKQLGITMVCLLQRPDLLERVRTHPELIRRVVEETIRWAPTDPTFARFALHDTELGGVAIPKGSVVHACFASGNRDPRRWDQPDEFDPERPVLPNLGFGRGAHACLGQHVARAEICNAITALLQRLPGLRLDPDADPPALIGMYERGVTGVPVVWDVPSPKA